MDDALQLARSGCPSGTVAAASYQEKGRGRVPGRSWTSGYGESLLATVILRSSDVGFAVEQLPLRAGAAVALGIEEAAGIATSIKWPNDVLVGGTGPVCHKKVAGVLCEVHGDVLLVGIGVNCSQESFPRELASYACSLRQACGKIFPPSALLTSILARLRSGMDSWLEVVRERLHGRGQAVSVRAPGSAEVVQGMLRDVDEAGRLLVELGDGRLQAIAQGELGP